MNKRFLTALFMAAIWAMPALAMSPQAAVLGAPAPVVYFVDSAAGNNANGGRSPGTALADVTALPAIKSGYQIALAKGSSWAQSLQIGAANAVRGVRVYTYGNGTRPILDAADSISSGAWSKTGGLTSVYNTTSLTFPNGQGLNNNFTPFVNVFDPSGKFVSYQTTQAAVDACSGVACYTTNSMSGSTGVIYLKAADGLAPAAGYTYTARPFSVQIAGAGQVSVTGVWGKSPGSLLGAFQMNGDGTMPYLGDCRASNGGKHNILSAAGTIEGCTVDECYIATSQSSSCNMIVFFETNGSGLPVFANNNECDYSTTTTLQNPPTCLFGHTSSGSFGAVTWRNNNVVVTGNVAFGAGDVSNAPSLLVNGGLLTGITTTYGNGVPTIIDNVQAISSNTLGTRYLQINAGVTNAITVQNSKICLTNTNQGMVRNFATGVTVTLTNNAFWMGSSATFHVHVFSDSAGMNLIANGNTFDGFDNRGVYSLGTGASGHVFTGDNNSYGHTNSWFENNVNYTTLANWKAQVTPQDTNSNTTAVGNGACS